MSDEKQSNFKITDRRKFNPDGTPRETPELSEAEVKVTSGVSIGRSEPDAANVLSFPGQSPAPERKAVDSPPSPARASDSPAAGAATQARKAAPQSQQQEATAQAYERSAGASPSQMPPATFLSIVNMLGIEAAMNLGMVQVPGQEQPQIDLEAARHMIDLLGVLQTKTRGNLSAEEDQLIENLLADLRMQFVSLSNRR